VIRAFKYPLYPNKAQEQVLNGWLHQCAELYNAALEQRNYAWSHYQRSISYKAQCKELTELRQSDPTWAVMPAVAQQAVLQRLDNAFTAFFKRCKHGEKPGHPRFKPWRSFTAFSFSPNGIEVLRKDRVAIPKLGHVKLKLYRELVGKIKVTHIRRSSSGKWSVSFATDIGEALAKTPIKTPPQNDIGIDLGLTHFATLSNGERIPNQRFYREAEPELKRRQQALTVKQKGSKSYNKAKHLVAKTHERTHNLRLNQARLDVCNLFKTYDFVGYENLNVKGMAQHPTLAKSIHDAAWTMFINCLISKAEKAGKWAVGVDPRGTSQTCSSCGLIVKKALSERVHSCPHCELSIDRDHNAAINILNLARLGPGKRKAAVFNKQ
jgi:putative transposase